MILFEQGALWLPKVREANGTPVCTRWRRCAATGFVMKLLMSVFIALNGLPAAIIRVSRETCVRLSERRSVDLGATFLRLVVTPTTPLSAAARHYVSTNPYASAIEEVEAGLTSVVCCLSWAEMISA
jgi:hypothetical protein